MKVGILTFPNSPSYGASLQMFALYQTIQSLGGETEVINYMNDYMKNREHYSVQNRSLLRRCLSAILECPSKNMFAAFEKQIKMYPNKTINKKEELAALTDRYDYLICGSDQVWNPKITGADFSYLFSFCEDDRKKLAYAPSFGFSRMPEELAEQYSFYLKKFKSLSIREEVGQTIIKDSIGVECPVVLDPTMLLTKGKWETQIKKKHGLPKHYIAQFIFNPNDSVKAFATKLAKEKGLPVINLTGNALTRLKQKNCTGPLGPSQFLYVLQNADYVITDSFHGAAFSIILEKELFVSLASVTNSRLVTLMNTFALNDRIITDGEERIAVPIDYTAVRKIMAQKREASMAYLRDALGGVVSEIVHK